MYQRLPFTTSIRFYRRQGHSSSRKKTNAYAQLAFSCGTIVEIIITNKQPKIMDYQDRHQMYSLCKIK